MSYSDDEGGQRVARRARSRSPSPRPSVNKNDTSASNTGLVAGVVLAGVGIVAAVGAKFLFGGKKASVAPPRPAASRTNGTRRKVPPRRPRSVTSGASSAQHSPTSSAAGTPMKGSRTSLPTLPVRRAAAPAAAPPAALAAVAEAPAPVEGDFLNTSSAVAKAAAAAVAAGAATAATFAAASPAPAPEPAAFTEPDASALKAAAEAAVKDTTAAIEAGNASAAAHAAETMEDVVDDQIALTKEEAVEAVVGLLDAAVDAEEAANDAETVLQHAEEAAAEVEEEEAPAAAEPAAAVERAAPAATAVEEEKKEGEAPPAVAAAASTRKSSGPSLPAKKKNGNKKKSAGSKAAAPEPKKKEIPTPAPDAAAAAAAAAEIAELTREEPPQFASMEPIPDEPEDLVESLDQIPHPTLDFSQAPSNDAELNEIEVQIRQMSLAAHKLIKDNQNKIAQAAKDQGAALDLALGPDGAGKVRPSLIAACGFALADMLIAQRQVSETKAALAVAYDAAQLLEGKNACVRALTNYAYVLRIDNKHKSARNCYAKALELAKEENGISSAQVEQVKYEFSGYLAKSGHIEDAIALLSESAESLLVEAERLDKEVPSEEEQKKQAEEEKKKAEEAKTETALLSQDPGTGLDHIAAEEEAATEAENQAQGKPLLPNEQARNFAMRNLLHTSELLDATGKFDEAEAALTKAMETAICVHGENSVAHMNVLYTLGSHYRRQGRVEEAIGAHEAVLNIMDDTIEVYEPELLQNRVAILRDTAILYDQAGDPATAVDYATGALVNAQTLAKIMSQMPGAPPAMTAGMLEPFWILLSGLKAKAGDVEGAAEAKREALRGKLNQGLASRGGRTAQRGGGGGGSGSGSGGSKRTTANGASSTRAGGRRV